MPKTESLPVRRLRLDLANYRTTPQANEQEAIATMISLKAEWFWALVDSLLVDGYHPTENIIVLRKNKTLTVREGNRRVAALKFIHGLLTVDLSEVPAVILARIESLSAEWKKANEKVPCAVYGDNEEEAVDRIVSLLHGKGDLAARNPWTSVARARHNRDANGAAEPALDLLEAYLECARNITPEEAILWSSDYPVTVLAEALAKGHTIFGAESVKDLAAMYPSQIKHRKRLDELLFEIGHGRIRFKDIRDTSGGPLSNFGGGKKGTRATPTSGGSSGTAAPRKGKAYPPSDPRSVRRSLKELQPKGGGREKLVALLIEARQLDIGKFPHAFCFLLRAMFELSAKAYCAENGLTSKAKDGGDEKLSTVLDQVYKHLVSAGADKRALDSARRELTNPNRFLSVRSMNDLIHNPVFSVTGSHISTVFNNIVPFLRAMNE